MARLGRWIFFVAEGSKLGHPCEFWVLHNPPPENEGMSPNMGLFQKEDSLLSSIFQGICEFSGGLNQLRIFFQHFWWCQVQLCCQTWLIDRTFFLGETRNHQQTQTDFMDKTKFFVKSEVDLPSCKLT